MLNGVNVLTKIPSAASVFQQVNENATMHGTASYLADFMFSKLKEQALLFYINLYAKRVTELSSNISYGFFGSRFGGKS